MQGDRLLLSEFQSFDGQALPILGPADDATVFADWFSGLVHGSSGNRRCTGYPTQGFSDQECVIEIDQGRVVHAWVLDLSSVRHQTEQEFKGSVPVFLWPERTAA